MVGESYVENCRKASIYKDFFFHTRLWIIFYFSTPSVEGKMGVCDSTSILYTFNSPCGNDLRQIYSRELMLEVMSRMLFCSSVSPFFSATSTLRML